MASLGHNEFTYWGPMTHISVGNLTIIGSDYYLLPGRCQAIIWNNDGVLWAGHSETNFSEISIENHTFSLKKMHLKISSAKWRPFFHGLNVLKNLWDNLSPFIKGWFNNNKGITGLVQNCGNTASSPPVKYLAVGIKGKLNSTKDKTKHNKAWTNYSRCILNTFKHFSA